MTVRSTKLALKSNVAAGTLAVFTCPAGWRAIVKSIVWDGVSATAGNLAIWVAQASDGSAVNFVLQSTAAGSILSQSTWTVMYPGDILYMNHSTGPWGAYVSGTLLQLTGQEPL